MNLSKQGENTIYPRCLDAATTASPNYRMQFYVRESDILLNLALTDISTVPTSYQKFTVQGAWLTPLKPGNYNYRFIDQDDDNRTLESGRVLITDTNQTTHSNQIIETITTHAI